MLRKKFVNCNLFGIIHALDPQNFTKNWHFILPDTHSFVCISGGKKT